jgi:hypothetical protein
MRNNLNLMDYQEMSELLLSALNIQEKINIKVRYSGKGSNYQYFSKTVSMGKGWHNFLSREDSFLHEFSHFLNFYRNKDYILSTGRHHDMNFQLCLLEVVKIWYTDISRYNWECEYNSIRKAYSKGKIQKVYDNRHE